MPSFPIIILFIVDIFLCIIYLVLNLFWVVTENIKDFFDLNGEYNLSSYFSSSQLILISIFLFVFSIKKIKSNRKAFPILCLPVIFLLMGIDETHMIHEVLGAEVDTLLPGGTRKGTIFLSTGIWIFAYGIPFTILFMSLIYKLKPHFEEQLPALKKLVIGMVILLSGALGVELINNFTSHEYWIIVIAIEEGLEMVGATVMVWASYEIFSLKITQDFQNYKK